MTDADNENTPERAETGKMELASKISKVSSDKVKDYFTIVKNEDGNPSNVFKCDLCN